MRLVIINDGTVGKDGEFYGGLDLSGCDLPQNFWAFQWNEYGDNNGHVEYNSPEIDNTQVSEVPAWATACIAVWQAKKEAIAAEEAEAAAAEAAAEAAAAEESPPANES
jgi:hypothetical protein